MPFPLPSENRPLRLIQRGSTCVDGRFASRKSGGMVPWRSMPERDFCLIAEVDPCIRSFQSRPFTLDVLDRGQVSAHAPAFLIDTADGLVACDLQDDKSDDKNTRRLPAIAWAARRRGVGYAVVEVSDLHRKPMADNAATLWRAVHVDVDPADVRFVQEALDASPGLPFGALSDGRLGRAIAPAAIHRLIVAGEIVVDLERPLSDDAPVWRSRQANPLLRFRMIPCPDYDDDALSEVAHSRLPRTKTARRTP